MQKETERQSKVAGNIVLILILAAVAIAGVAIFMTYSHKRELDHRPEQSMQAEVVEKRVRRHYSPGHRSPTGSTTYTFIVSFEFPDSSVKEFEVDIQHYKGVIKNEPDSFQYDSFTEGDTGILTYKEIENIEERVKNEDMRYDSRRFISFEKDLKYGGLKVEAPEEKGGTVWEVIIACVITFAMIILVVAGMVIFTRRRNRLKLQNLR